MPSSGDIGARLLIVGLAPGRKGANRTGRPFLGDKAGEFLFAALLATGFATKNRHSEPDGKLQLHNCRITNAVKCVPPGNKPLTSERDFCNGFLKAEIASMPHLRAILCLGGFSHEATLAAMDLRRSDYGFSHKAQHSLPCGLALFDSYHCSQQVTNTKWLTPGSFRSIFKRIKRLLDESGY